MEDWKKALILASGGLAALCLVKGSRIGVLITGGIALAALASEYPEKFSEIRENLPDYIERGTTLLEVATRLGERIADIAEMRTSAWYEALIRG